MNEDVEIYYYRKNDITDYRDIVLRHAIITRERLNRALGEAKAEKRDFVVFEKNSTSPDFWLVLNFCFNKGGKCNPELKECLGDIRRELESVMDDLESVMDDVDCLINEL